MSWLHVIRTFVLLLVSSTALAQPVPPKPTPNPAQYADREPIRLAVRGVSEMWQDTSIGSIYRPGALMFATALIVPAKGALLVDIEAAFRKLIPDGADPDSTSDPRRFSVVPISVIPEYHLDPEYLPIHVFAGFGPTFTLFSERFEAGSVDLDTPAAETEGGEEAAAETTETDLWAQRAAQAGAKVGFELRVGARLKLDVLTPRPSWDTRGGLRSIEFEVYGAKRMNKKPKLGQGLNLNAWRAGFGLALGF